VAPISSVVVTTSERTIDAYLAVPPSSQGRGPAVIIIHEIFGPDAHIRSVVERFAVEGYVAIAPDLFTGEIGRLLTPDAVRESMAFLRSLPPEVQRDPVQIQQRIAAKSPREQAPLKALRRIQDPAQQRRFGSELVDVARYLRGRPMVDPRGIGAVGFCFGGAMAGLLASLDPELRAAVIFYGNNPPDDLIPNIRCPVLGQYGSEDHRITDTVPSLSAAMAAAGKEFTFHVYPEAQHAFFNDSRPQVYREEAARLAWQRTLSFLKANLGERVASSGAR